MKIYIETMGCQMNRLDSELVDGDLRRHGHEIVAGRTNADVVIYNTCSVRQQAENKVCSRLGADGQRKSDGKRLIVAVIGCMAQKEGQAMRTKFPQVDIVCAPSRIGELSDMIASAAAGEKVVALDPLRTENLSRYEGDKLVNQIELNRPVRSSAQAFVRVAMGCDFFCSYCIVPFVRGPQRSRRPEDIITETRRLLDGGVSEITLLGQTVNGYSWSDGGASVRFSDLLCTLSGLGMRRLRFVTSHPLDFGDDILEAMRDLPNVCPYIHCPAQSGSDAVLKRMNRKYTRAQYDELVARARDIVPDVVIAGDFIVGFPGETEKDHEASGELIRKSGYKNSFVFKYSPRPGTLAQKRMPDDVPMSVKRRRNNELLAVQEQVGLAHHRQRIGSRMEVLVEGPSPRSKKEDARARTPGNVQLVGRTRGDHIVVFEGSPSLAGEYAQVAIEDATSLTLFGRLA